VTVTVRPVDLADAPAFQALGAEAFGVPATPTPAPTAATWPPAEARPWGAFDGDTLAARLLVRGFTSWFHGATLPTAGFAGVTVAAEARGGGLVRRLFDAALAEALERGEVISTLYPSAAGIYQGLGYATVGAFDTVHVPLSALARVPAPADGTRARRAGARDLPAVRAVYDAWAAGQNGPLTRIETPFAVDESVLDEHTGVTLAVDPADRVVGFATWDRGPGHDRTGRLEVEDLVALTPDAARTLWRALGSFGMVVGAVALSTSGLDPARLVLPDHAATLAAHDPYMLRILDVPGALGPARVAHVTARVPFAVSGRGHAVGPSDRLAGAWTLEVVEGAVHVTRDGDAPASPAEADRPTFTPAGLAASYAGAQSTANLRLAGHLAGPATHDLLWDALWGGRQVHVRDYF
jgi:predicted acetyltransferase